MVVKFVKSGWRWHAEEKGDKLLDEVNEDVSNRYEIEQVQHTRLAKSYALSQEAQENC